MMLKDLKNMFPNNEFHPKSVGLCIHDFSKLSELITKYKSQLLKLEKFLIKDKQINLEKSEGLLSLQAYCQREEDARYFQRGGDPLVDLTNPQDRVTLLDPIMNCSERFSDTSGDMENKIYFLQGHGNSNTYLEKISPSFKPLKSLIFLNACHEHKTDADYEKQLSLMFQNGPKHNLIDGLLDNENLVIASSFQVPVWYFEYWNRILLQQLRICSGKSSTSEFVNKVLTISRQYWLPWLYSQTPTDEMIYKDRFLEIQKLKGSPKVELADFMIAFGFKAHMKENSPLPKLKACIPTLNWGHEFLKQWNINKKPKTRILLSTKLNPYKQCDHILQTESYSHRRACLYSLNKTNFLLRLPYWDYRVVPSEETKDLLQRINDCLRGYELEKIFICLRLAQASKASIKKSAWLYLNDISSQLDDIAPEKCQPCIEFEAGEALTHKREQELIIPCVSRYDFEQWLKSPKNNALQLSQLLHPNKDSEALATQLRLYLVQKLEISIPKWEWKYKPVFYECGSANIENETNNI